VAALRLAERGIPTVVLERGKRWPIRDDGKTLATFEAPDGRASWLNPIPPTHLVERALGLPATPVDTFTGVWEHIAADGMDVVVGAAVVRCPSGSCASSWRLASWWNSCPTRDPRRRRSRSCTAVLGAPQPEFARCSTSCQRCRRFAAPADGRGKNRRPQFPGPPGCATVAVEALR
jgi:hypothetical protein